MPSLIHELIAWIAGGLVEHIFAFDRSERRRKQRKLRSGTSGCPSPQDVIGQTVRRHLDGQGSFAEFRVAGADKPWVQIAHDDGENAVNFYYPFDEKDVLAVLRRYEVEIPRGSLTYVKVQQAATYTIPAPAETEVNRMVHQLFSRLYTLEENYTVIGTVED